ncbi:amino acid permease [Colletotrichum asianum]|uniref:Amino acid permease n=1 Tax=Colletotrichum asianum TaxID=702518 RepID=A0A8H3WV81_9PEZI|nr:amino acid permease [Colletotrichum asianum]
MGRQRLLPAADPACIEGYQAVTCVFQRLLWANSVLLVQMMLAIGGVIGPGYFVGMGTGLTSAGPAGLLLCFTVVGVLL